MSRSTPPSRATRRGPRSIAAAAIAAGLCFAHCGQGSGLPAPTSEAPDGGLRQRVDASLAAALGYLVDRQSPDGAWRSEVYGLFRDGPSLTPHVLSALAFIESDDPRAERAIEGGAAYVASLIDADGRLRVPGLEMPVYVAAAATWVEHIAGNRASRDAWLAFLRGHQLDERLGWSPDEPDYGGWGYAITPPRKRPSGSRQSLAGSNLSATLFALGALRTAGTPASDPAYARALRFVERCQNYPSEPARSDPAHDDGGFFFSPGKPARNKAGSAGSDRHGRERYRSYGSMTADGVRALLVCGLAPDDARVVAARAWLERNFLADANPGRFNPDREVLRDATYFYWNWSVAHAFTRLGLDEIGGPGGRTRWADALARELLRQQRADGSWVNGFTDSKEDDPLVATPLAAAALAIIRRRL